MTETVTHENLNRQLKGHEMDGRTDKVTALLADQLSFRHLSVRHRERHLARLAVDFEHPAGHDGTGRAPPFPIPPKGRANESSAAALGHEEVDVVRDLVRAQSEGFFAPLLQAGRAPLLGSLYTDIGGDNP